MSKPKNKFLLFDQYLINESNNSEVSLASKLKTFLDRVEVISDEQLSDKDYIEPIISKNSLYEFKKVFLERLSEDINVYIPKILGYDNNSLIDDIHQKLHNPSWLHVPIRFLF